MNAGPSHASSPLIKNTGNTSKGKDIEEGKVDNNYSSSQLGKVFADNEWFQVDKYIKFFNVTTEEVLSRLIATTTLQKGFLDELSTRPDLYGPIWISIILGGLIFVVSTVSHIFMKSTSTDFQLLFSSISSILIYLGVMSGGGWAIFKWMGISNVSLTQLSGLMGYSLLWAIPIALIGGLKLGLLTWIVVMGFAATSAYFIFLNLQPSISEMPISREKATIYSGSLGIVQILFLLSLKLAYF